MRAVASLALFALFVLVQGCSHGMTAREVSPGTTEAHFKSLKQLTFEGTHAEAYFSPDGKQLIFQGRSKGCDQMYVMNTDGSDRTLVSVEGGRNTCGYFIDADRILYSSTHLAGNECPKERDRSKGYVWEIFKSYDIYTAKSDGSDIIPLTNEVGYDAESTVCGDMITFASARSGNGVHVYTMKTDGSAVRQLTKGAGYYGGPFWSRDCKRITYRAFIPSKKELAGFKLAISQAYIPPGNLEVWAMNADGSNKKQLTAMNTASFAPSFFHDGKKVIFSSALSKTGGRAFQLYSIDSRKTKQVAAEAITAEGTFNGFPMFSPDGKYLVFASNRHSANPHELQIFLAEWKD